jgi:S-adenosylhomocysteine hydrolase
VWDEITKRLQSNVKNGLLISLDDGADLLITTPAKLFNGISYKPDSVIGIEQTRGGSNRLSFKGLPFPVINVAGSWIKNIIEYPKVAKAVAEKISLLVKNDIEPALKTTPIVGIIGYGNMGKAITQKLVSEGYMIGIYDQNEKKDATHHPQVLVYPDISLLIANTDIIIGCTGEDVTHTPTALNSFLYARQNKWLISVGSKDMEFKTLLETAQSDMKKFSEIPNPLADIHYQNRGNANIAIIRGGFPINFDNSAHSVPPEEIWPTRAALLLACMMSTRLYQTKHPMLRTAKTLQLDSRGQRLIFNTYKELNPNDECLKPFANFSDAQLEEHIVQHSEGEPVIFEETLTYNVTFKR